MAALAAVIAAALLYVLCIPSDNGSVKAPGTDVSISAARGSVVTVRKVGRTTRVDIHPDIHDHWEGSSGVDIAPTPIEVTRREEPELYAEYMDPHTTASRRYAIADYIYSLGLTLPYIHGMNEQWRREQEQEQAEAVNPITERTPVNPQGGELRGGLVMRRLDIDQGLREEPMYDMSPEPDETSPEEEAPGYDNEQTDENNG